jgi:hypothetical protein
MGGGGREREDTGERGEKRKRGKGFFAARGAALET